MNRGLNSAYRQRVVESEIRLRLASAGAVVLEGPKACGKTATAAMLAGSAVMLDVDEQARRAADVEPALVLAGKTPRLIDEWQAVPAIWNHIRRAVDAWGAWPIHPHRVGGYGGRYHPAHGCRPGCPHPHATDVAVRDRSWHRCHFCRVAPRGHLSEDAGSGADDRPNRGTDRRRRLARQSRQDCRRSSRRGSQLRRRNPAGRCQSDRRRAQGSGTNGPPDAILGPQRIDVGDRGDDRGRRCGAQALDGDVFHYRDNTELEVDAIMETQDGRWAAFEVKLGQSAVDEAAATLLRFADRVDAVTGPDRCRNARKAHEICYKN